LSIRNLKSFFRPRSVALLGASARSGSVGNVLARNLQGGGFGAALSFVHPKADVILGVRSVASVDELPEAPELAVVATPAPSVPGIVDRLGERGTRAVVIVTAGAAGLALLLVGVWYAVAWLLAEPARLGAAALLVVGLAVMVAALARMPE